MLRNAIFLLILLSSLGFAQRRDIHPEEMLDGMPGSVSDAADRARVVSFLKEKESAWRVFGSNTSAGCPDLLNGTLSVFDFAAALDAEEEKAERAISTAYARLLTALSPTGRSELEADLVASYGYAIETRAIDTASKDPAETERRYRFFCQRARNAVVNPMAAGRPLAQTSDKALLDPKHPLAAPRDEVDQN